MNTSPTIAEQLLEIARHNNGALTSAMLTERGISRGHLLHLVKQGRLLRGTRGTYYLPDTWEDDFLNIQNRFKKGIFSHQTALYLWELTDNTPLFYNLTFPSSYNISQAKHSGIRCHQVIPEWYDLGLTTVPSPCGHTLKSYNRERTLCDLLRSRTRPDDATVLTAFKSYLSDNRRNIPLLLQYAHTLRVSRQIHPYLTILL